MTFHAVIAAEQTRRTSAIVAHGIRRVALRLVRESDSAQNASTISISQRVSGRQHERLINVNTPIGQLSQTAALAGNTDCAIVRVAILREKAATLKQPSGAH